MSDNETTKADNFVRKIIKEDIAAGTHGGRVHTRFPPEPNGYLHIGHAKSICLNFGVAEEFGGQCNLRFDDTNPEKEEVEYVDSIKEDIRWLGFQWEGEARFASDYFEQLYAYAEDLITQGKAYVDSLSMEEIREYRGTLNEPGRESPYRERTVEENLDLFRRMRDGEFADGEHVLRARVDMASPRICLRDPVIYRIRRAPHHRTGDKWCIYPMYDFTHCLSDAIEGITHSLCTLEFEDNRALYDWFLDNLDTPARPRQYEFARLNLDYMVLSKRRLIELVRSGRVAGWDDPRMPTICGIRRRGYTPASIREFCERIGVTRNNSRTDMSMLEDALRSDLGENAPRAMAVLNPLRVVIENYPEDGEEWLQAANHPQKPEMGTRQLPFSRVIYIERDDFMEEPPKKFFRLAPGREVRLRYAYFITCNKVIKDNAGEITELRCSYDPQTRGGDAPDGRKVKGTLHWVSELHAVTAEVRLYDRLFSVPRPDAEEDWMGCLNPESIEVLKDARVEPALAGLQPEDKVQFERLGYFCADRREWSADRPVFNRAVTLRDTWSKLSKG
ncbi:MAG: glutamine--tRNA ligase/YqeY domain fusion protein [Gammaproteobacteria bacterium]